MRRNGGCFIALTICAGVTACADGSVREEEDVLIGPDRTYTEALGISEALLADVTDLVYAEGGTRLTEMPVSGTAEYRGVVAGQTEDGFPVDYVADLTLEMEFDGREVSGRVSNMVTDGLIGFVRGDIDLDGFIVWDTRAGRAFATFEGSAPLSWPGQEAMVTFTGGGNFVGDEAQALLGQHLTEFRWTEGYLADTTSNAYGLLSAVRAD